MSNKKINYKSSCCGTGFQTRSNGLWDYYVCNTCGNKTERKKTVKPVPFKIDK